MRLPLDKLPIPTDVEHLKKKPETPTTLVEFDPNWFDEHGLPTKVGEWIESNLEINEARSGVRWVDGHALQFYLHRDGPRYKEDQTMRHTAHFNLVFGGRLYVSPGNIIIYLTQSRKSPVLALHRLVLVNGQPQWRLIKEARLVTLEYPEACPAIAGYANYAIDRLVYRLTGHSEVRTAMMLWGLGPGFRFQDPNYVKPTDPMAVKIFEYLVDQTRETPIYAPYVQPSVQDAKNRYYALNDHLRRMALDLAPQGEVRYEDCQ